MQPQQVISLQHQRSSRHSAPEGTKRLLPLPNSHQTLPHQLPMSCRQDPYCIVKVGGQQLRTKTAKAGGKNPVW